VGHKEHQAPLDPGYLLPILTLKANRCPALANKSAPRPPEGKRGAMRSIKCHMTFITCCLS